MITPTRTDKPWDPGPLVDRLDHDCEFLFGFPHCYGSAATVNGYGCTCTHLNSTQHAQAEADAALAAKKRHGRACDDCLYRSSDFDEQHDAKLFAREEGPFHCHKFMPLSAFSGVPERDAFAPRDERLYPICAGWSRARKLVESRKLRLVPKATDLPPGVVRIVLETAE